MVSLILIDVQYLQNAASFESSSNVQKIPPRKISHPPPLNVIWKTLLIGPKGLPPLNPSILNQIWMVSVTVWEIIEFSKVWQSFTNSTLLPNSAMYVDLKASRTTTLFQMFWYYSIFIAALCSVFFLYDKKLWK